MKLNDYQEMSTRTMPTVFDAKAKSNYAMGLAGEAGEVVDLIKKEIHHGHPQHPEGVLDELGDVFHYLSGIAKMYGFTLEEVATHNIQKLAKRYPEGFDKDRSLNRKLYGAE